jgi:hypothetical protein
MNAISLNRLKYLFREYFAINWKRDLSAFAGLFLVKTFFIYSDIDLPDIAYVSLISIVLIGISCPLNKKLYGMNYLLSPANTAEKTIAHILLAHIYFTAIPILICILSNFTIYILLPHSKFVLWADIGEYHHFLSLFSFQAMFLFFTIYFRKHALIKTLLVYAAFVVISMLIFTYTGLRDILVLSDKQEAESAVSYGLYNGVYAMDIMTYVKCKSKFVWLYAVYFSHYIPIVFFWVLSYFRLRETEV